MSNEEAIAELKDIYEHDIPNKYDCYTYNAFNMAFKALERLIQKKPIGKHTDYRCSVCGKRVRSGKGSSSRTKDTVCRNCFTVIDWSEDDE